MVCTDRVTLTGGIEPSVESATLASFRIPHSRAMVSPAGIASPDFGERRCAYPQPALRITFRKYHVADVETAHEVSEYVDLATLEPCDSEPAPSQVAHRTRRAGAWPR